MKIFPGLSRYVNMKVAVVGGLALGASQPLLTLWKAARCDVPKHQPPEHTIPRESEVKTIVDLMAGKDRTFAVLTGIAGAGKTRVVCAAARQRGSGVLYVSGAGVGGVMQEISRAYEWPIPTLWEIGLRMEGNPGWKTVTRAAYWYSWWFGQRLVLIIDHFDNVPDADAERLLDLAKEAADDGTMLVLFVTSEGMSKLRGSTSFTRAREEHLGPVSVQSAKDLLAMTKTPERHWDEVIYLSGCNLLDIWYYIHGLQRGSSISKLKAAKTLALWDAGVDGEIPPDEVEFWNRLLEAGPSGFPVPDHQLACNFCARIADDGQAHFRDGVCVDYYARRLQLEVPERKWEQFQCQAPAAVAAASSPVS